MANHLTRLGPQAFLFSDGASFRMVTVHQDWIPIGNEGVFRRFRGGGNQCKGHAFPLFIRGELDSATYVQLILCIDNLGIHFIDFIYF